MSAASSLMTGENTRPSFVLGGQQTAGSGETVGIYLFRTTDPA